MMDASVLRLSVAAMESESDCTMVLAVARLSVTDTESESD